MRREGPRDYKLMLLYRLMHTELLQRECYCSALGRRILADYGTAGSDHALLERLTLNIRDFRQYCTAILTLSDTLVRNCAL